MLDRTPARECIEVALRCRALDPLLNRGRTVRRHHVQQSAWRTRHWDHRAVFAFKKAFVDGMTQKCQEPIEIAFDVEQTARLLMEAELRPGENFEEFFQGAPTTRQAER